jgi:hypothetical protein
MDWTTTLTGLVVATAGMLLFGWLGARPPDPLRGPRLAPYRLMMLVAAAAALLFAAHLLALAGVSTGR